MDADTPDDATATGGDPSPVEEPSPAPVGATSAAAADRAPEEDEDPDSFLAFLRELPVLILVAFALAFLLRTFVIQVFYIPSASMEPTLMINDRMIVEKVTFKFRDPRRGEIVVFEGESSAPADPNEGAVQRGVKAVGQFLGLVPVSAKDFVKRVIGLPGDEIEIDDQGVVSVNGTPIDEPYVVNEDLRAYGPYTVPEGEYFFLGDNRANSSDSRSTAGIGFVQRDHLVGRAVLVLWPFDHLDLIDRPDYPSLAASEVSATTAWFTPGLATATR